MATVTAWNPFGVSLNITATAGTVTRTSATQFTVRINASWESYWGAKTNYGMTASSGGGSATINPFGTKAASGSGSFTGTYSISGNGSATKTITVTFRNFNSDNGNSATQNVSFNVTVPAWTSYTVSYNANGGSGAPSSQTKWKNQTLTLSSTKPIRTGYSFSEWNTASGGTGTSYKPGGSYTANSGATLYAQWTANTYAVKYDANGGTGAPSAQTKTYGVTLSLSSVVPTRKYYNFLGWSTSSTATVSIYAAGSNYTSNAAITLYAVWELAYVKPRINNLNVSRCTPRITSDYDVLDFIPSETGTYALIKFDWACDRDGDYVEIAWKKASEPTYTNVVTRQINGSVSGSITQAIGAGTNEDQLSVEYTYTIQITVYDVENHTVTHVNVPGVIYPIDVLIGGRGISFGRRAELEDTIDANWTIYPRKGYIYPVLEKGSDLDDEDYRVPNKYILQSVRTAEYTCGGNSIPITSGTGMLTIESFGPEGQVKQIIEVCSKINPVKYERYYYQEEWGDWYEAGGYKSAITVGLTGDITLGVTNNYTQIPFSLYADGQGNGLSLTDGYVKIGTGVRRIRLSCQVRVTTGTAYTVGNRHIRLCVMRNGVLSYLSWHTLGMEAGRNDTILLTPIVYTVEEGDLIYAVFYTSDAADVIYAGSPANGYQTYLTVESI